MKFICFLTLLFFNILYSQDQSYLYLLDSLKKDLESYPAKDTNRVKKLEELSFFLVDSSPEQGLRYGLEASRLSQQLNWKKGIAKSSSSLAVNYYALSKTEEARQEYKKALVLFEELGMVQSMAATHNNLSLLYINQNNYVEALKEAYYALRLYESVNSRKKATITLENIGHIYFEQKEFSKALSHYNQAMTTYKKQSLLEDIARVEVHLSRVYKSLDKDEEAFALLQNALKKHKQFGNPMALQNNLSILGNLLSQKEDFKTGINCLYEALSISQKIGHKKSIAVNMGNIGDLYLQWAKSDKNPKNRPLHLEKAIIFLNESIQLCNSIKYKTPLVEFYESLSEAYQMKNNYKDALTIFQKQQILKDSLFNQESKVKLAVLETERAIKLKNKDIIIKDKELKIKQLEATNKSNERILFLSGISLILLLVILLYLYFKRRDTFHKNMMASIIQTQSHEIRGPVASILGLLQLFNSENPNDPLNQEIIHGIHSLSSELDETIHTVIKKTKR